MGCHVATMGSLRIQQPFTDILLSLSLVETLDTLEDPRVDRTQRHNLTDILVPAVLAGHLRCRQFRGHCPSLAQLHEGWLHTFPGCPTGSARTTCGDGFFARQDAIRFEEGFRDGVPSAFVRTDGQVVSIDGKNVRGSHDRGRGWSVPGPGSDRRR